MIWPSVIREYRLMIWNDTRGSDREKWECKEDGKRNKFYMRKHREVIRKEKRKEETRVVKGVRKINKENGVWGWYMYVDNDLIKKAFV